MANPEHVAVVLKGAAYIEEWRKKHPGQILNLSKVDLSGANLFGANLSKANLQDARLVRVNLVKANLSKAKLSRANLTSADLAIADLSDVDLSKATLEWAALMKANLSRADLSKVQAGYSNFVMADLSEAKLSGADLFEADLSNANLSRTDFSGADLSYANLKFAKFHETNFSNTNLTGANLSHINAPDVILTGAKMGFTTIVRSNLAQGVGLETVKHEEPSNISIDTLILSFRAGENRFTSELETFFLNSGVPKELLDALPRILAEVQYCTCFVCYGQPDLGFAERLVKDLKARGVSSWLYSMDYTPGEKTWGEIIQKRREAEKMIVLCSASALIRGGVLKEIEEQKDEDPDKMVPISLDNLWKESGFSVKRGQRDLKPFLLELNYADFTDESTYNKSLRKLLKGLKRT